MEYRHTQTAYKSALFVEVSLVVIVPIVMGLGGVGSYAGTALVVFAGAAVAATFRRLSVVVSENRLTDAFG